jgi:hypothetical protein
MGHPEKLDLKSLAFKVLRKNKTVPTPVPETYPRGTEDNTPLAVCGSSFCAGCYAVSPGTFFHPPKCGVAFLNFHKANTKKN